MSGKAMAGRGTAWGMAFLGALVLLSTSASVRGASAQDGLTQDDRVIVSPAPSNEPAPPRKRRASTRLRVYPNSSYLPPNAVRQCVAHYEQEYRQSGTVIVPKMHCWWEQG
jgi:hypothetical protein